MSSTLYAATASPQRKVRSSLTVLFFAVNTALLYHILLDFDTPVKVYLDPVR